ncbi:TPA: ead/Ea22-like family protein [Klebsiella pneumoniae]|uniref:ead/Ea22-like family protein n=1 Tax=Klebsiella pneumoniae TaxID=573 RepID=UPI0010D1FC9B|nr:ead/Ea22-like family protein [Klebsiella pneumoniae]VGA26346.1 Ead domain protein [Klebsiella pneumoniae]
MTDITELAQSLKAAAEKATPGEWVYFPKNTSIEYDVGSDESQGSILYVDSGDFTKAQTDRNGEFIALANPANILALVEALENSESRLHEVAVACATAEQALEKAQQYAKERDEENQDLMLTIGRFRVEREGLEAIRAAAEKLVRCKGRYHSEQNYRALAALFGVNTPDLPPLDDESHAVTVENLQESAYRAGLTAGWNLGLANNNDGFNKCLAAHAAGIKVEVE